MNFTYAWSTGAVPKPNVENVIYFYFVLGWFYILHALLELHYKQPPISRHNFVLYLAVLFLFLRHVINIDNNISTAYLDLLSGKAAKHNDELNKRYALLKSSNCQVCIVEPLTDMPKSLYLYDITQYIPAKDSPINRTQKLFWNKKGIYLSKPGPSGWPTDESNLETLHSIGRQIKHRLLGQ
ncbi:hypothetical protein GCM10027293_00510 [Pontibacter aydingkolensis]